MGNRFNHRKMARTAMFLCGMAAMAIALTLESGSQNPAAAQDEAQIKAGQRIYKRANCAGCHGWAANGEGNPRAPNGPSLRITQLDREGVYEVVQCGRLGTGMPSHDRKAYKDDRCYGGTAEDFGDDIPPPGKSIRAPEIEKLVAYLFATVVGRAEITLAECEAYWGVGAGGCRKFR